MKRSIKNGSSLLLVLILSSFTAILVTIAWRTSSLYFELSLQKVLFARQLSGTEGLLNYAIELGKENYDGVINSPMEKIISITDWLKDGSHSYSGKIVYKGLSDFLEIRSYLVKDKQIVCALKCHVIKTVNQKEGKNFFEISSWGFIDDPE